MKIIKLFKKYKKIIFGFIVLIIIIIALINIYVNSKSKRYIYTRIEEVPACYTAIVLGALVSNTGYPSKFLKDRMDVAIELYTGKKIKRFLLSGDHGRKNYDEVNSMKNYLLEKGINTEDIFLDHAGFDTYSTIVRAKEVFGVEKAIIVTQEFHLSRAVYIARSKGIEAYGIKADRQDYYSLVRLKIRETIAKVKAFSEVMINKKPRFLGNKIPITGDSKLSYD
jgi:SanA protein